MNGFYYAYFEKKGADANGNQRTSGTYYSKKHNIKKGNVVMEAFIAAGASITVGVLSLVGVIITNANSNRKIEQQLETAQAVTDCKIDELTREVREHNNFARRMPVVEDQIRVINHRIKDLEQEG